MIKKILLSLGIIGLGIINFSSASCPSSFSASNFPIRIDDSTFNDCWTDIGDYTLNIGATAGGTTFTLLSNFNFLDSLDNKIVSIYGANASNQGNFWWGSDGYLHFSVRTFQLANPIFGHFNGYYYCTQYTQLGSLVVSEGCTFINNYENIEDYLSKIDKFIVLRFSSSSDIRSGICGKITEDNTAICFTVSDYFNPDLRSQITVSGTEFLDYENVSSIAVDSPYIGGGSKPDQPKKQNYICPTFGQLLKQQNFNTGLCYNTTLRIQNGQLTTIPQKNIQEAFTDYEEFTNYRSIYKNKCDTIQGITEECESTFTGEIEKYIIIANAEETGINKKILWNNCNIVLNYDLNTTTCVASGYTPEQPTEDDIIERIVNGNYTTINDIYVPGSGNILNRLLEDGETREKKANRDILGNFTQLVGKITSIFHERKGVNGIIPEYILWLIFVSLFLTVILKK